jgi:hypothetical protein
LEKLRPAAFEDDSQAFFINEFRAVPVNLHFALLMLYLKAMTVL